MTKLLHIDSSGKGSMSVSQPLTQHFAEKWKQANSGGTIVYRHLLDSNLRFVTPELVGAFFTPAENQSKEQVELLKQSEQLIAELFDADEYVFGVPMYNFTVPAVFKAYIDLIVRAGKTFSYDNGVRKGLLLNKKLTVISASGGDYSEGPAKGMDFVEPYVRTILGFVGVTDITFVKAHGTDPDTIAKTTTAAKQAIDALFQKSAVRA